MKNMTTNNTLKTSKTTASTVEIRNNANAADVLMVPVNLARLAVANGGTSAGFGLVANQTFDAKSNVVELLRVAQQFEAEKIRNAARLVKMELAACGPCSVNKLSHWIYEQSVYSTEENALALTLAGIAALCDAREVFACGCEGAQGSWFLEVCKTGDLDNETLTIPPSAPEPLVYSYTRADALVDGEQVDVTEAAREAGIKFPVFLTRAVWDNFVRVPAGMENQDESGRLWDIVFMLRCAAKNTTHAHKARIEFYVSVQTRRAAKSLIVLNAVCGPVDIEDPRPAITVMMPHED